MATITKIKWVDADFKWNIAPPSEDYKTGFKASSFPFTWGDVALVEEVAVGGSGSSEIAHNVNQLDPEKKKRFIKLVCKVKGIETYSGQKTIREDIEITAEDIELVVKEVLGIELKVENIHV
tara:strand:+ start:75 stop:440 length:366 start_codon:yes stop_codon:yes gene_type:complete